MIPGQLKEQHRFGDYLYWNLMAAVPLLTALVAVGSVSIVWLIIYLIVCAGMLAVITFFFCTHCPHYLRSGATIQCMFFWRVPKFFKPKPSALSLIDKLAALAAPAVMALIPLYWLLMRPSLLLIYLLSLAAFAWTMRRYECPRCTFADCPSNCAPMPTKDGV